VGIERWFFCLDTKRTHDFAAPFRLTCDVHKPADCGGPNEGISVSKPDEQRGNQRRGCVRCLCSSAQRLGSSPTAHQPIGEYFDETRADGRGNLAQARQHIGRADRGGSVSACDEIGEAGECRGWQLSLGMQQHR
jgi:hypothetical protein